MQTFNYNQAIFGLLLIGAKADGVFQPEEKELIVELTTDVHEISAEEYRDIINASRELEAQVFNHLVYNVLNQQNTNDRLEAMFWLVSLMEIDQDGDNSDEQETLLHILQMLNLKKEELDDYIKSKR